jgi:hypothetical protein
MSKKVVLCAGCGQVKSKMTREHFWPQWLIRKTKTNNTGVRSMAGKKIPPSAFTIPLCKECNDDFGKYLESPVSSIFDDLENNKGISDFEAELLVRWLWKLEGLHWTLVNPVDSYSPSYKLRERVLLPIDKIRPSLILAISLIKEIDLSYGDAPLGLDSFNRANGIFVAGVFSRIAIMVLHENFVHLVPQNFSQYNLADTLDITSHQKNFFPQTGFKDDTDAVAITLNSAQALSKAHDVWVVSIKQYLVGNDEA